MAIDQGRITGAAQGAKLGSTFGPIGTGIGAVVGAVFGGGKGSYAATTGHHIIGTIDENGFHGQSFGLASNGGTNYRDLLDNRYGFIDTVQGISKKAFTETFGAGAPALQIDWIGPVDGPTLWKEFEQGIRSAGSAQKAAASMNAPAVNSGSISGGSISGSSISGSGSGFVRTGGIAAPTIAAAAPAGAQPQTIVFPAAAAAGIDTSQIAWGIGLALFTWWLSKQ